ncbi:MAG: hypothetical protein JW929_01700 [Anaerolineales bacterium]|nr:hypothetical protein [Anaerolineales bacterium]
MLLRRGAGKSGKIQGIDLDYLTRRYADIIPNAFRARTLASSHLEKLSKTIPEKKLSDHFGFSVSFLCHRLAQEKADLEERIFLDYVKEKKLVLAVSNDPELGYRIPDADEIVSSGANPYQYYLFNDVDVSSMNSLERHVGELLDRQQTIVWWFKNRVKGGWYSIQGWRENRFFPDFVAAKKNTSGKLDIVYILEAKGEHIAGNEDTTYKKQVLDLMTEQSRMGQLQTYVQKEFPGFHINEKIEEYLVEEGQEEAKIRSLFSIKESSKIKAKPLNNTRKKQRAKAK